MDRAFTPKLAKKARLRVDRHAGSYLLVYPERGLVLNETAAAIVKLCDGAHTLARIIDAVAGEVAEEDRSTVERDVVELIERLADKGLVEP